jgi:hypothetical protein
MASWFKFDVLKKNKTAPESIPSLEKLQLISSSWKKVIPDDKKEKALEEFATEFYDLLQQISQDAYQTFSGYSNFDVKQLPCALNTIILLVTRSAKAANARDLLHKELSELGRRHRSYGVEVSIDRTKEDMSIARFI